MEQVDCPCTKFYKYQKDFLYEISKSKVCILCNGTFKIDKVKIDEIIINGLLNRKL